MSNKLVDDDDDIGGYKQFFVNNSSLKRPETLRMATLCLSHQDASADMQRDLFR